MHCSVPEQAKFSLARAKAALGCSQAGTASRFSIILHVHLRIALRTVAAAHARQAVLADKCVLPAIDCQGMKERDAEVLGVASFGQGKRAVQVVCLSYTEMQQEKLINRYGDDHMKMAWAGLFALEKCGMGCPRRQNYLRLAPEDRRSYKRSNITFHVLLFITETQVHFRT